MVSMDEDKQADLISRKLSYISLIGENPQEAGAVAGLLLVDYHRSTLTSISEPVVESNDYDANAFSLRKIYKNLFVLSFSLLLAFTAYSNISSLQSSLNTEKNVGVNSLIITHSSTIFSAIFVTNTLIDILGYKWTMILSIIPYIFYILANIHPLPSLMYISAVGVGIFAAPLWTSQALYLNRIGRYHGYQKKQAIDISVSLFFGLYTALQGTSIIWGNLFSYFILNQSNNPQKEHCGINFDPQFTPVTNQTDDVNQTTRYVLSGIFAGIEIVSMLIIIFMLDPIPLVKRHSIKKSLKKSFEVLISLGRCKYLDQIFLIPITMWIFIEGSFFSAQFNRAFTTCLIGIKYVGLVMVAHGICYVISSYVFGWLVKYIDRIGCFLIAAILNYSMIILMYLWQANNNQTFILFIIAGAWGTADAIWQSQVIALYTVLYSEKDPSAVAKYRLWKSVGSVINYSYASYITIRLSLILLIIYLSISIISYGLVEVRLRRKKTSANGIQSNEIISIK